MSKPIAAFSAALSLAFAATPSPGQAPPTQPARWHLDGSTDRCLLTRRLEGTPMAATFILRTIPGSGRYDFILAAPDLPAAIRRTGADLAIAFSPGARRIMISPARVELPRALGDGAAFGPLSAQFVEQLSRASTLRIADPEGRELASWTIPLAARAAEAFAACEAEKLTDWGADPAAFERGATPPRVQGDPDDWLTGRDLGLATATTTAAYTAAFRIVIGTDGRVADCTLVESAGNVNLSDACRVLRGRARFDPARNAAGDAIRSVIVHYVGFRRDVEFRWVG
jgi:hypothetical protein